MKAKAVFIHLNTPSSKNSKRIIVKEKNEKCPVCHRADYYTILIHSKTTAKYIKMSKLDWLEQKAPFRHLSKGAALPLVVGMHFVRGTKHKYDWINMVQIVQDLMVEYHWIEDDNVEHLIPIPFKMKGEYSSYDKERPGVWIVPITHRILEELKGNLNE